MLKRAMVSLLQLFSSLLRIILLLVGIMLVLSLATSGYQAINAYLTGNNYPCLEVISSLVVITPIVAIFYGVHIRKFFWQRMRHYNLVILIAALIFGIIAALLPSDLFGQQLLHCAPQAGTISKAIYALGTALTAAIFAFIGVDIGVTLKHLSLKLHHKPYKKTKRIRRKKR